jgi:ABC-type maltose transport system permease subunit
MHRAKRNSGLDAAPGGEHHFRTKLGMIFHPVWGGFVMIRLARPVTGVFAIALTMAFTASAQEIKQNTKQTVTVWLDTFITTKGVDWGALMAASTLVALPIVIMFALIQRKVATGLTAGAVKG